MLKYYNTLLNRFNRMNEWTNEWMNMNTHEKERNHRKNIGESLVSYRPVPILVYNSIGNFFVWMRASNERTKLSNFIDMVLCFSLSMMFLPRRPMQRKRPMWLITSISLEKKHLISTTFTYIPNIHYETTRFSVHRNTCTAFILNLNDIRKFDAMPRDNRLLMGYFTKHFHSNQM